MEELQYLAIAYAGFALLIVIEMAVSALRADGRYGFGETVANLSHGIAYQTLEVFAKAISAAPFVWVATHVAPVQLPLDEPWAWGLGFVLFDFFAYWAHRHSHEVNLLWAVHAVHHASEDYNLAAALRQPLFLGWLTWVYHLPLALVGVPVEMMVGLTVFNFLYQFWLHTRYLPKLGPLEWVLNTPSHHRVHHGRDTHYLDRNHGNVLIVWDRLFGTFAEEREEPDYGLVRPLDSWNPLHGNLFYLSKLWRAARRTRGVRGWLRVWLGRPAELVDPDGPTAPRPTPRVPAGLQLYVRTQALLVLPALPLLIYQAESWPPSASVALAVGIGWSLLTAAGLCERRPWARAAELARIAALTSTTGALLLADVLPADGHGAELAVGALLAGLALAAWLAHATRPAASSAEPALRVT